MISGIKVTETNTHRTVHKTKEYKIIIEKIPRAA